MTDGKKHTISASEAEKRKAIQKRVLNLERYNYNQKEFTQQEMVAKIKKIIEEETNKHEN